MHYTHLALHFSTQCDKIGLEPTNTEALWLNFFLKQNHNLVITLEDGVLDGGFGEKVARFYGDSDVKVLNYGAEKDFPDRVSLNELYQRYRLTKEQIIEDICKNINLRLTS